MAQWVQAPFTKPDDSSVIHRTHGERKAAVGTTGQSPCYRRVPAPGSVARLPYRLQEGVAIALVIFRAGSTMVPSRGEQGQVT